MLHFTLNPLATAYDDDTIAAYTAELNEHGDQVTVFFDIDYARETIRSVIHLHAEHDDYLTTDTRDWPAIEAVLPRLYWPTDIHHTAKSAHSQLAAFGRLAREDAREYFAAMRADDARYAGDAD